MLTQLIKRKAPAPLTEEAPYLAAARAKAIADLGGDYVLADNYRTNPRHHLAWIAPRTHHVIAGRRV